MGLQLIIVFSTAWIVFARCAASQDGKPCLDAAIPVSKPRGVNQVGNDSTEPLFELEVIPRDQSGAFEVRIVAAIQAYAFRDVTVAMTTHGTCGKGDLHYNSGDFHQIQQDGSCPTVLATKRTTPMTRLPSLLWTSPSCGCVQFRVMLALAAENYYYAEAEEVSTGFLAKRVCVEDKRKELSREQRLDALCQVSEKHTSRSILSSITFRKRHQLDSQYTDRLELEMALELRRSDARMCCSKVSQGEKMKCFEDARYRRADRFCQDGFPDVPFVSFRSIFMRSKERRCCSILGVYRYLCFAKDSQLEAGNDVTPMDYSLDATDLVNDLAEFATLEDYQEVRDKMFNASTRTHEVLHDKNNPKDDNVKGEDVKDDEKRSESGKKDSVKTAYSQKILKVEALKPKITDHKASMRNNQPAQDGKTSTDKLKPPKPKPSTSPVQRTQAKRDGGLSRSEMTKKSSEIYRRLIPNYSKARRRPQTSAERRKHGRRTGGRWGMRQSFRRSGERKDRDRKLHSGRRAYTRPSMGVTGTSKDTGRRSRRLTSSERRHRGFQSSGKSREVFGGGVDVMEDIDNQGGATVEDTLNHLDRKMKGLELRRLCCESGALSGSGVYGSVSVVMTECKHSSQKYLQREEISFGTRKCRKQFVRCCMDEAKMGLTMSSTEFHNKAFDGYLDNVGTIQSDDRHDGFLHHDLLRKRIGPKRLWTARRGATLQEILEAESDRRFESMRAEAGDSRFVGEEGDEDVEEDEEKTGPTLFDEEDNSWLGAETVFDDVTNRWVPTDKKTPAVSQIKERGKKSRLDGVIDTEAKKEQKGGKVKDDDEGDEKREQMKEDFDDGKNEKDEDVGPKVVKEKEDEMIQSNEDSRQDINFSKYVKIPQNNVKDEQKIMENISGTVSQSRNQFQNKSRESHRFNTTQNVLANTQNRGKSNESIVPSTSELMRPEFQHPRKETNNTHVESSRLSKVANSWDNVEKRNSSDTKDVRHSSSETDVSETMSRKGRLPSAKSHDKARQGSRLTSVHDKSAGTDIRSRLDLNEERDTSLIRRQKVIAPRGQYYRRSRERSRFGSGTADTFLDTYPTRSRSRQSRRREGGSSRRRSRYSQRLEVREKRVKGHETKNRQVAMDSQEMATAHDERLKLTALDSKEMATRYDQGNEAMDTFKDKDTFTSRTGGSSKRRRRHRKRFGQ